MEPAPTAEATVSPEAVELLRREMAEVEAAISGHEAALAPLRERRTRIGRALTAIDPQWAAAHPRPNKPGPKPGGHQGAPHGNPVSSETKQRVLAYIRQHFRPGEDITGPMIHDRRDSPASHSVVTRALRDLQTAGLLRLDRMGDGQHNRTKVYRLTDETETDTS